LNDGAEILVRRNGTAPVAALAWNGKGTILAFAAEDGDAGFAGALKRFPAKPVQTVSGVDTSSREEDSQNKK